MKPGHLQICWTIEDVSVQRTAYSIFVLTSQKLISSDKPKTFSQVISGNFSNLGPQNDR